MKALEGKTAWITGSGRGIGYAIAERLAEEGAKIVIHDIDETSARNASEQLRSQGHESIYLVSNVTDSEQIDANVNTILEKYGSLDILVNNAGITRDGLLVRMKDNDWDSVMAVNLKGAFVCTRRTAKVMMKQRSGRIVNVASVVGIMGNAGQSNYAASKAGLIGFTKSCARELAPRGITVNAIAPGYIETEMTKVLPDAVRQSFIDQTPLGRPGTPNDVSGVVYFLVHPDSSFLTGQVVHIDGGMLM